MKPDRMRRINELLHREISDLCERELLINSDVLVTITGVKTSPDLRHAGVYVSVLGTESQEREVLRKLEAARVVFQKELAHRVKLKYTPVLVFKQDKTLAQADRLLHIIEELELDELPPAEDNGNENERGTAE